MSHPVMSPSWPGHAAEMRAEFDDAFSRPVQRPAIDLDDMLVLGVGAERFAVPLSQVAEVISHPALTAVPTSVPALRGLTSVRGALVAVYDLGILIGRSPTTPNWLLIPASMPTVGVAFDLVPGRQQALHSTQASVSLLQMPALVGAITALTHSFTSQETAR